MIVIAKENFGVPGKFLSTHMKPVADRSNKLVWPVFEDGPRAGELIEGSWVIAKDQEYEIDKDDAKFLGKAFGELFKLKGRKDGTT